MSSEAVGTKGFYQKQDGSIKKFPLSWPAQVALAGTIAQPIIGYKSCSSPMKHIEGRQHSSQCYRHCCMLGVRFCGLFQALQQASPAVRNQSACEVAFRGAGPARTWADI